MLSRLAVLVTATVACACVGPGVHDYVAPFDEPTRGFSRGLGFWGSAGIEAHEVPDRVRVAVCASGERLSGPMMELGDARLVLQ